MSGAPTWPSSEALDHLELTRVVEDRGVSLVGTGDAAPRERSADPPPQIVLRSRGIARVLAGLKAVIRLMVKVVYLFPVLLVAKLVLRLMDNPAGDMITVAFVVLIVVFFLLFALFFLLYPLAGPPSRRKPATRLRLPDDLEEAAERSGYALPEPISPHRLAELCEPDADVDEPVRVRGVVVPTARQADGDAVLRDCWLERDGAVLRMAAGGSFTVCAGDEHPPVVVSLEEAVHLVVVGAFETAGLGQLDRHDLGKHEAWLRQRADGLSVVDLAAEAQCCTLRVGDEVELVGGRHAPIPSIEEHTARGRRLNPRKGDHPEGSPYRGEGVRL